MNEKNLSTMEIDAIGEILNISLGASATAVSTMLDARVDITTPVVRVVKKEDFSFTSLKPAIGVEISYIEGLSGKNVMLLKRNDVKVIVEMLMGMTFTDEEFELNEMNISAISEVMNQMMGASATALSELFGRAVNISTPNSFEVSGEEDFKEKYFISEDPMVVIGFSLSIDDKMKSEFLNLMSIDLAKELVSGFFTDGLPDAEPPAKQTPSRPETGGVSAPAETQAPAAAAQLSTSAAPAAEPQAAEVPQSAPVMPSAEPQVIPAAQPTAPQAIPAAQPAAQSIPAAQMPAGAMEQMMQTMMQMQQTMMQMQQSREERRIPVKKAPSPSLRSEDMESDPDANLDLLMGVPLELSVEIGRTKKLVRDILELNKGSLVVLDRIAGEPVDLYVNGECIAKGDVVVVDDNFGIRITEILQDDVVSEE